MIQLVDQEILAIEDITRCRRSGVDDQLCQRVGFQFKRLRTQSKCSHGAKTVYLDADRFVRGSDIRGNRCQAFIHILQQVTLRSHARDKRVGQTAHTELIHVAGWVSPSPSSRSSIAGHESPPDRNRNRNKQGIADALAGEAAIGSRMPDGRTPVTSSGCPSAAGLKAHVVLFSLLCRCDATELAAAARGRPR